MLLRLKTTHADFGAAALLVVLALIALMFSGDKPLFEVLHQWDSLHYHTMVTQWVMQTPTTNSVAAWFPGYPLLATIIETVTPWSARQSLHFISIFSALIFWFLFLTCLRSLGLKALDRVICVALVLCYPASFILVCNYSESTYMSALVGIVYLGAKGFPRGPSQGAAFLLVVVGALTRLLGIGLLFIPACQAVRRAFHALKDRAWDQIPFGVILTLATVATTTSWLLYCEIVLKQWDIYVFRQSFSWGHQTDLFAFFNPTLVWRKIQIFDSGGMVNRAATNNIVVRLVSIWHLAVLVLGIYGFFSTRKVPSGYLIGTFLFSGFTLYMTLASTALNGFFSADRYLLPSLVSLTLLSIALCRGAFSSIVQLWMVRSAVTICALMFAVVQHQYLVAYGQGRLVP